MPGFLVSKLVDIGITEENASVWASSERTDSRHGKERLLHYSEVVDHSKTSKWLATVNSASIIFTFSFKKEYICSIGVKSGGDCIERDPKSMIVSVPDSDGWR